MIRNDDRDSGDTSDGDSDNAQQGRIGGTPLAGTDTTTHAKGKQGMNQVAVTNHIIESEERTRKEKSRITSYDRSTAGEKSEGRKALMSGINSTACTDTERYSNLTGDR